MSLEKEAKLPLKHTKIGWLQRKARSSKTHLLEHVIRDKMLFVMLMDTVIYTMGSTITTKIRAPVYI